MVVIFHRDTCKDWKPESLNLGKFSGGLQSMTRQIYELGWGCPMQAAMRGNCTDKNMSDGDSILIQTQSNHGHIINKHNNYYKSNKISK